MAVWTIVTLQQWFIGIRLCQTHLTCLHAFSPDASHHGSLPQQPRSDLNPVPENRVRGAFPHPTHSMWLLLHGARHFLAHCEHGPGLSTRRRSPSLYFGRSPEAALGTANLRRPSIFGSGISSSTPSDTYNPKPCGNRSCNLSSRKFSARPPYPSPKGEGFTDPLSGTLNHCPSMSPTAIP